MAPMPHVFFTHKTVSHNPCNRTRLPPPLDIAIIPCFNLPLVILREDSWFIEYILRFVHSVSKKIPFLFLFQ
jgi:hypothetical protein